MRAPSRAPGSYCHLLNLSRKLANFYQDENFPDERVERIFLTAEDRQVLFALTTKELQKVAQEGKDKLPDITKLKPDLRRRW